MLLDVFDTYVTRSDGVTMHFDVLMPAGSQCDSARVVALRWLNSIGETEQNITQQSCRYCHSETATPEIEQHLNSNGYFILQMEGCPSPVI